MRLNGARSLRTHVPVHLEGVPQGVKEGGIVENQLHEVEIECLPKDIPESFVLDISELQVGDSSARFRHSGERVCKDSHSSRTIP